MRDRVIYDSPMMFGCIFPPHYDAFVDEIKDKTASDYGLTPLFFVDGEREEIELKEIPRVKYIHRSGLVHQSERDAYDAYMSGFKSLDGAGELIRYETQLPVEIDSIDVDIEEFSDVVEEGCREIVLTTGDDAVQTAVLVTPFPDDVLRERGETRDFDMTIVLDRGSKYEYEVIKFVPSLVFLPFRYARYCRVICRYRAIYKRLYRQIGKSDFPDTRLLSAQFRNDLCAIVVVASGELDRVRRRVLGRSRYAVMLGILLTKVEFPTCVPCADVMDQIIAIAFRSKAEWSEYPLFGYDIRLDMRDVRSRGRMNSYLNLYFLYDSDRVVRSGHDLPFASFEDVEFVKRDVLPQSCGFYYDNNLLDLDMEDDGVPGEILYYCPKWSRDGARRSVAYFTSDDESDSDYDVKDGEACGYVGDSDTDEEEDEDEVSLVGFGSDREDEEISFMEYGRDYSDGDIHGISDGDNHEVGDEEYEDEYRYQDRGQSYPNSSEEVEFLSFNGEDDDETREARRVWNVHPPEADDDSDGEEDSRRLEGENGSYYAYYR